MLRKLASPWLALSMPLLLAACGGGGTPAMPDAMVNHRPDANLQPDANPGCMAQASTPTTPSCTGTASSNIQHLVVIVQENHTFDNYFGNYCTAAVGSNPTCTDGPGCCEKANATDPGPSHATPK